MTTVPPNITANIGLAGGSPNSPEDTAAYLTQLQQSLNGFTGSTAAALNYLLQTGIAASSVPSRNIWFSTLETGNGGWFPPGTSGYAMAGFPTPLAIGPSGGNINGTPPALFTPSVTGRVAVIGWINVQPNYSNPGDSATVNALINFGTGSTSYNQGTTGPTGTQVGLGSILVTTCGDSDQINKVPWLVPMALLSGLSTTTQYWVDIGISYSTNVANSACGPSGSMLIFEC